MRGQGEGSVSPTTGCARSKQPGLAVLSVTSFNWQGPLRMVESGDGSVGQESFHTIAPCCPLSAEFPVLPAQLSSPTHLPITKEGSACLPRAHSRGPGIKLPANQLLPPVLHIVKQMTPGRL